LIKRAAQPGRPVGDDASQGDFRPGAPVRVLNPDSLDLSGDVSGDYPPGPRAVLRLVTPGWDRFGGDGRRPEIPANREKNREFFCFSRFCAKKASLKPA